MEPEEIDISCLIGKQILNIIFEEEDTEGYDTIHIYTTNKDHYMIDDWLAWIHIDESVINSTILSTERDFSYQQIFYTLKTNNGDYELNFSEDTILYNLS